MELFWNGLYVWIRDVIFMCDKYSINSECLCIKVIGFDFMLELIKF